MTAPAPVSDRPCWWCREPILAGEAVAFYTHGAPTTHRECAIRSVIGSVGHQLARCSCYGGTEDDPPGMSRREAAAAAEDLFRRRGL